MDMFFSHTTHTPTNSAPHQNTNTRVQSMRRCVVSALNLSIDNPEYSYMLSLCMLTRVDNICTYTYIYGNGGGGG